MQIRDIQRIIQQRLAETGGLIQIVIGPRQVGKTTALKGALNGRGVYFSADSPSVLPVTMISEHWQQAYQSKDQILAIDEIQKIPKWNEEIKRLWDSGPKLAKVILTGSASLLLEKGLSESLAGRFELIHAEHWNAKEALNVFNQNLESFIEFGCYPGAAQFLSNVERWSAYVRDSIIEPAIGRDILQLHPVESPALLREILGVAVALPAQVVSLQKIQGQLQSKGAVATVSNYLKLLSKAFLVTGIQKYTPNTLHSRQSSPKLIVHDNAIARAFERPVGENISKDRFGHYLENAIGARFIEAGWDVYYWNERTREVDFVVIGPNNEHWAIEVKSGRYTDEDLSGLRRFKTLYPQFTPKVAVLNTSMSRDVTEIDEIAASEILSLRRRVG